MLAIDLSNRGIELTHYYDYQIEILIDGGRMAQVVQDLAANAREAMPRRGTLKAATRRFDQWVGLRFGDTGSGVPEDACDRSF